MSNRANEVDDLERIYADAYAVPIQISYAVIKSVTKNFAQVIGNGAFGVVYLGGLQSGMVAVKKLSQSTTDLTDTQFLEEVKCLKRVNHRNIVRFLGYCADSQGEVMEVEGKLRIVEVPQRLLCFEYAPNGSLDDYLQEKPHGYEWHLRYQIIKGICQGLHYLHQRQISHLDLKPANVLLGANMEPKITDFGLSRCIEGKSTIFTKNLFGTPGYMAPEFIDEQKISFKSDIFSLGIIMKKLHTQSNETIAENGHEPQEVDSQQMKRCIQIAKSCADSDPSKRPTIAEIVLELNKTETRIQKDTPVVNEPRNDPRSSLYQVVKRFHALSTRTLHEYSRFADIYEDLNVLERILEGIEMPSNLPYPLLQFITANFSNERRIGHNNELGERFKGIAGIVAVTRLPGSLNINDGIFHRQIANMTKAQHQNLTRFVAYCSYAVEKELEIDGKIMIAEKRERLLCFEYLSRGNLSNHLSDELRGLEWHTRYQIIKGICKGLCYLHKEKDIIHMDLKPSSILLDDQMVPKITDFCVSELIIMSNKHLRQLGYSAPESMFDGVTSRKADIYSLGVIIIELVTGSKKKPIISNVLSRWEQRWSKSSKPTPSEERHQVTKCLELAQSCLHKGPNRRPFVWDIIRELDKLDNDK